MKRFGIDPSALQVDPSKLKHARLDAMLVELRRADVIDDDELAAMRERLNNEKPEA